jgi:hypothetical protein
MATFAADQDFTVAQSANCTTYTLTDTSNYTDNDESYTINSFSDRRFLIYDSTNTLIDTISLGINLTATYALTKDEMLIIVLSCTPTATGEPINKTHSVLSTCFLELAFANIVSQSDCDCGCSGGSSCDCDSTSKDKITLLEYIKAAQIFAEYSNPVSAQKQLDAGNVLVEANLNN